MADKKATPKDEAKKDEEVVTTPEPARYLTPDGDPMEPSTLPPKYPVGVPDAEGIPGVKEVSVEEAEAADKAAKDKR